MNMNTFQFCLAIFVAASLRATAQVSVEIALDQDQFLPGEEMVAAVKISNRSGEALQFGRTSEWLTLHIEGDGSFSAVVASELPDGTPFSLESPRLATKRLDIEPFFRLTKPGRYKLTAQLRLPGFDQPIESPVKKFDIISGTRLWEQEFGVPGSGHPPVVRTYLLQQANYLKQLQLYLRVTESKEQHPVGVVRLGQMVSFGHPTAMLDRTNDLHVIFQDGPRSFRYCVLGPEGKFKVRQTWTLADARPHLVVDEEGAVSVKGGLRARSASDLPVVSEAELLIQPPTELPGNQPTNTSHATPPPS
jgi:hypothetical protein